jgi:hypothetical protein
LDVTYNHLETIVSTWDGEYFINKAVIYFWIMC